MGNGKKIILACICMALIVAFGSVLADKQKLSEGLIRLHVVGESDSQEDQNIKLKVRDAVVEYLQPAMAVIADAEQAKIWISRNLSELDGVAEQTLSNLGCDCAARVSFCREEFPKRVYDSFTLPAGVYDSLRITIGDGEGKNWWCVVFPTLCFSATAEELDSVAAGAGFSDSLTAALTGEAGYEVRFFLLDALGWLENMFASQELPPVFWTDSVVS